MSSSTKLPINTKKQVPACPINIREFIKNCAAGDDPDAILRDVQKEFTTTRSPDVTSEGKLYKAMTLLEFEKGTLMADAVPNRYRTFCIDFSRNLQKEYNCQTPSEKATVELIVLSFARILETQHKINTYLATGLFDESGIKYLAILSKELDRANRHYLNTLQTLKMLKQPVLEVNIRAQTAVVGQNQVIQSNNK